MMILEPRSKNNLGQQKKISGSSGNIGNKKVMLIVVDSLMSKHIDQGLDLDELPAFKYLIEEGIYYRDLVSSFPTMSVVIDSSLLTGTYPDQHQIPGLIWYSAAENRLINYGTGKKEVIQNGINQTLIDILYNINQLHLNKNTPTFHEELSKINKSSGSINCLIYRGSHSHTLRLPPWIYGPTSLPEMIRVHAPLHFTYGAFSHPLDPSLRLPDGVMENMGFNNEYALKMVEYLVKNNQLPDLLLIYLPDLDKELHKFGPDQVQSIQKLDQQLGEILSLFGSWKLALQEAIFIVMGDGGHTQILPREKNPVISLRSILEPYKIVSAGEEITNEHDLILAVNERMAYIYPLNPSLSLHQLASRLLSDDRIDMIAWEEEEWIYAMRSGSDKTLKFHSNGEYRDLYNQYWTIDGESKVLDLKIRDEDKWIEYRSYPDVLRRLYGALRSHQAPFLILNAKPGYEFQDENSPLHLGGGAHGSIHAYDSYAPLIISGTKHEPKFRRIVDLKGYILELLKPEAEEKNKMAAH